MDHLAGSAVSGVDILTQITNHGRQKKPGAQLRGVDNCSDYERSFRRELDLEGHAELVAESREEEDQAVR